MPLRAISAFFFWFLHVDLYPYSAMWMAHVHYKIFLVVHKDTNDDIYFVILEIYLSQPLTNKKSDDQITFYNKAENHENPQGLHIFLLPLDFCVFLFIYVCH